MLQMDDSIKEFNSFREWLGDGICTGRTTFEATNIWNYLAPDNWECVSIGLLPSNDKENFASVSSGAHDAGFRTLAKHLKDPNVGAHVIVRLGWEFNGDWEA